MGRVSGYAWALAALAACPGVGHAQARPAPFYTLPPAGTWVEYDWQRSGKGARELKGTFRIGVVGETTVRGKPFLWVEVKKETALGDKKIVQWRKLLVAAKPPRKGGAAAEGVRAGFDWGGPGTPVKKLSSLELADFLGMGITGAGTALKPSGEKDKVKTGLGEFVAERLELHAKSTQGFLEFRVWRTDDVPFGWAKMEIRERDEQAGSDATYRATAARRGKDAAGEVDETKAK